MTTLSTPAFRWTTAEKKELVRLATEYDQKNEALDWLVIGTKLHRSPNGCCMQLFKMFGSRRPKHWKHPLKNLAARKRKQKPEETLPLAPPLPLIPSPPPPVKRPRLTSAFSSIRPISKVRISETDVQVLASTKPFCSEKVASIIDRLVQFYSETVKS